MYCPECGNEVKENAKFCAKCGTKLNFAQKAETPVAENKPEAPATKPVVEKQVAPVTEQKAEPVAEKKAPAGENKPEPVAENKTENKKSKTIIIILSIIIAILLGVGAGYVVVDKDIFGLFDSENEAEDDEDESIDEEDDKDDEDSDAIKDEEDSEDKKAEKKKKKKKKAETEDVVVAKEATETAAPVEEVEETVVEEEVSEYILEYSSARFYNLEDLYGMTAEECRIARNEIYARHGRLFSDAELQAYFNEKSWYEGYIDPDDFKETMLNDYEIFNRDLIIEYEKSMGYR